jgi:hypothetical protein
MTGLEIFSEICVPFYVGQNQKFVAFPHPFSRIIIFIVQTDQKGKSITKFPHSNQAKLHYQFSIKFWVYFLSSFVDFFLCKFQILCSWRLFYVSDFDDFYSYPECKFKEACLQIPVDFYDHFENVLKCKRFVKWTYITTSLTTHVCFQKRVKICKNTCYCISNAVEIWSVIYRT